MNSPGRGYVKSSKEHVSTLAGSGLHVRLEFVALSPLPAMPGLLYGVHVTSMETGATVGASDPGSANQHFPSSVAMVIQGWADDLN